MEVLQIKACHQFVVVERMYQNGDIFRCPHKDDKMPCGFATDDLDTMNEHRGIRHFTHSKENVTSVTLVSPQFIHIVTFT